MIQSNQYQRSVFIASHHSTGVPAGLLLRVAASFHDTSVPAAILPKHRYRPRVAVPDGLRTRAENRERGITADAAAILGLKPRKLQAMAQRGEIPGAAKLGRLWTFDLAKLRRFVDQQEKACRDSAKPRGAATGATGFSMPSFKSGGDKSGGRLGQMIRQLQRRVGKQSRSER
jgi:helix-turn-helix protein